MSTLSFDPYYKWLGIPPAEQPANHYRLLGINLFEDHPDVIESAADQRMVHLRPFQTGQHAAASQKLLNEVSGAKLCLLKPEKKAAYDARLRARLAVKNGPASATAEPLVRATPLEGTQFSPATRSPTMPATAASRISTPPRRSRPFPPPIGRAMRRDSPERAATARQRPLPGVSHRLRWLCWSADRSWESSCSSVFCMRSIAGRMTLAKRIRREPLRRLPQ